MSYKEELLKIYDECIAEIFEGEKLGEEDTLNLELLRESIIAQFSNQEITAKDEKYVMDNLPLYKRMIKATITQDQLELKKVTLEMLKAKNKME